MPYDLSDLPFLLILPLLLVGSAFFSGSETALFGLTSHQRFRLLSRGGIIAAALRRLLHDPSALLATLMLGNMTMNVGYFVVSSALVLQLDPASLHPAALAAVSLVPLLVIIVCGEIVPKLIANTARERWVRATSLILYPVHRLLQPFSSALTIYLVAPLGRLFAPPPPESSTLEADELSALLEMSQERGVIRSDEQQILREVLLLSQLKVSDVMVPRVDIVAIDLSAPPDQLLDLLDRHRLTKIVAIRGDLDHVQGLIYTRQFLLARRLSKHVHLDRLVRQVRFVPELQRVDQLLEDFRKTGTQVAIAVDEYGGTAGLVFLKDVVEQIIGDLDLDRAPGEDPQSTAQQLRPGEWRVSGRLPIHDWIEAVGPQQIPPRVATVGGLVTALLGRVPQPGDQTMLANLQLEVERTSRNRVESVILRLRQPDSAAPPPGAAP